MLGLDWETVVGHFWNWLLTRAFELIGVGNLELLRGGRLISYVGDAELGSWLVFCAGFMRKYLSAGLVGTYR